MGASRRVVRIAATTVYTRQDIRENPRKFIAERQLDASKPKPRGNLRQGDPAAEAEPWSQRIGALTTVPLLIRSLGADPAPIIAGAGLRPDALDQPSNRIPSLR